MGELVGVVGRRVGGDVVGRMRGAWPGQHV